MSRFTITVTEQTGAVAPDAAHQSSGAPAARQSVNAPVARQSVMARQSVPAGPVTRSCAPPAPVGARGSTSDLAPLT